MKDTFLGQNTTKYMRVSEVLTYLKRNVLGINQYTLGNDPAHFFNCDELKTKLTVQEFRSMECEVVTHWVTND